MHFQATVIFSLCAHISSLWEISVFRKRTRYGQKIVMAFRVANHPTSALPSTSSVLAGVAREYEEVRGNVDYGISLSGM